MVKLPNYPQFETQAFVPGEKFSITINSETDVKANGLYSYSTQQTSHLYVQQLEDMQNVYGELKNWV